MRKSILAAAVLAPALAVTGCNLLVPISEAVLPAICKSLPAFFTDRAEAEKWATTCDLAVGVLLATIPIIAPPPASTADK